MGKFFTEREIRAVAVFLPLAGLLVLGLLLVRPKADPAAAPPAAAVCGRIEDPRKVFEM